MFGVHGAWWRIRLSREDVDAGELLILENLFRESFIARNGPAGAALYGAWAPDHGTFVLYFTPQTAVCARALFEIYSAETCEAPALAGFQWLYGDPVLASGYGVEF
jgi:hypothetical protein